MDMVADPCWKGKSIENDEHRTKKFPMRRDALIYIYKHGLKDWEPFGLAKDGFEWYQIRPVAKEPKGPSIGDTLRALYNECGEDRDVFVMAAEMLGVKASSAQTYWYSIKKERQT